MAPPNRMSLSPGLLWLTLNLSLIIPCLSWNNIYFFFNFTYPLRCLRVPQVEYHCSRIWSCITGNRWRIGRMILTGETEVLGEKRVPKPLFSRQIPYGLVSHRNQASAVRGRPPDHGTARQMWYLRQFMKRSDLRNWYLLSCPICATWPTHFILPGVNTE
jgi:hypothetical protein